MPTYWCATCEENTTGQAWCTTCAEPRIVKSKSSNVDEIKQLRKLVTLYASMATIELHELKAPYEKEIATLKEELGL